MSLLVRLHRATIQPVIFYPTRMGTRKLALSVLYMVTCIAGQLKTVLFSICMCDLGGHVDQPVLRRKAILCKHVCIKRDWSALSGSFPDSRGNTNFELVAEPLWLCCCSCKLAMASSVVAATQSQQDDHDLREPASILLGRAYTVNRQRIMIVLLSLAALLFADELLIANLPVTVTIQIGSITEPFKMKHAIRQAPSEGQASTGRPPLLPGSSIDSRPYTPERILRAITRDVTVRHTDDEVTTKDTGDMPSRTQTAVLRAL